MSDFVHSKDIPKKYYRYFLKGLTYYTCHLNKACTLADLQAYVFLKSLQQLSEEDLTFLSTAVMGQLVSTGIAYNQNGYYRLNELLRFANGGSSSKHADIIDHSRDSELSSGSGLRKVVNFSNTVTMWPIDTLEGVVMLDDIGGALNNPKSPYLADSVMDLEDTQNTTDNTDVDNQSDSDKDGKEDSDGEKAETKSKASSGNNEPDTGKDLDSSHTTAAEDDEDDADDEDSNTPQNTSKQVPDNETKTPESEDDTPKQE